MGDQLVYMEITILYRDPSLMKGNRMQTLSSGEKSL